MSTTSRFSTFLLSGGVALLTALLLLATSPRMPLVWDEGDTIVRAEQVAGHLGLNPSAEQAPPPNEAVSFEAWPFTTVREGHPPLAAMVAALGQASAPSWFDPLSQARFGPIVLFALAAGAMFYRLERDYGVWQVSVMALGMLWTMPRLFAHAHFATLDGPLTSCWLLAWACFAPACRSWAWTPVFGAALGLTFSAKFTGWLAPAPFLLWALLYRDRRALVALGLAVPIALAVFIALNPPLWAEPVAGLRTFFELNLNRAARPEHNISTQFFGRMYNLDFPLPWYNTLVWTAITIAPLPLVFGLMGIWTSVRRWRSDRTGMLLVLQWATLIVVRALPGTPPHDAERLILPSFAFFAALAGVGVGRAIYRESLLAPQKIIPQGWAKVAMALALGAATFDSLRYFPHSLSYYSRAIGGVRGATALGMEATYYWDALDDETLAWLRENTAPDEKIRFAAAPPRNLELLKRWGKLAKLPGEPGRFRWYVLQRRPSGYSAADRWLVVHGQPAWQQTLFGVPLLDVYSYSDYERAAAAISK